MARRKQTREPRIAVSLAEIASIWGVTPQAVQQWQSQAGFPRNPDGTVTIKDVLRWRFRMESQLVVGDGVDDLGSGDSPALEAYRWARAKQEEIKLRRMQGELLPTQWVDGFVMDLCNTVRTAGETLRRNGDDRGADVLGDALDSMQRRVEVATELGDFGLMTVQGKETTDERETEPDDEAAQAGL